MSMLKRILFTLCLLIAGNVMYAQGVLTGTITDEKTKEPLPFVNVIVLQNGEQKGGAQTGMDGTYQIKPLSPGTYDIQASFVGYGTIMKKGVKVVATGFSTGGDIALKPESTTLGEVTVIEYSVPLIQKGEATSGSRITSDDIEKITANSVDAILATMGGVQDNDGGAGSARGEGSMQQYVNGAKRSSVNVPKSAIQDMQVILGGTPAQYGESIGGTMNITLKPPQNKFEGMLSYRTSEPFNTRGYHRGELYLTGPVWTKTNKTTNTTNTLVGFRLSGFFSHSSSGLFADGREPYMIKDSALARVSKSPLVFDQTAGVNYSTYYLHKNSFEQVGRIPNIGGNALYLEGGLDFRLSNRTSLKINGEFTYSFGKNSGDLVLNNDNNSSYKSHSYQIMADFTHKLSTDESSTAFIKNVMFNALASYERSFSVSNYNPDFEDDYFKYGYIGKFTSYWSPTYNLALYDVDGDGSEEWVRQLTSWSQDSMSFQAAKYNPGLAAYTNQIYYGDEFASVRDFATRNADYLEAYKGLMNGSYPSDVYKLYTNVGISPSSYSKSEYEYIYAAAKISADIGKHQVEIGFQYDQKTYSSYSLAAGGLWTLMRQRQNMHNLYPDYSNPIIDNSGYYPVVTYDRNFDAASQSHFDKYLRDRLRSLGYNNITDVSMLDIDSYDPDVFSLDLFSTDELYNLGGSSYVSMRGYDHTGKRITGKTSLQDFFHGKNGNRVLGSWQPIYMAGYIQDQFLFSDLVFNIGVRVDRFDGNQMVLKDPYLIYDAYTVKEMRAAGNDADIPATIPGDAVVYVNQLSEGESLPTNNVTITGFRRGYGSNVTWYTANGEITSDPKRVAGASGQPLPFRKGTLLSTGFPSEISVNAFEDYEPQVVAMPRIAFSFPVSDQSEFKASYDVIARRPSESAWQAPYASYLRMTDLSEPVLNNPNLKPEKITNYELGFQQVLSKNSALTISAYYKQTRDLINLVQYVGADPNYIYYSYDNQDYRTTKGMTIQYDLRRIKNVRASASYTLQYAEGTTGLGSSTIVSLIRLGYPNVKMMFPISDDRRHAFKFNLDFRYEGGDKYNGPTTKRKVTDKDGNPRVKTIKWLQNFGVNFTGVVQSGTPYTKLYSQNQQTIVGSFRGSRLPWYYRVDMTIDKAFIIKVGKRNTILDIFCSVTNLFNFKNITSVYSVTGDPDDDGYLTDPETQADIRATIDETAFRNYYQIYLNSVYRYSTPRSVEIGVSYQF